MAKAMTGSRPRLTHTELLTILDLKCIIGYYPQIGIIQQLCHSQNLAVVAIFCYLEIPNNLGY